MSSANTCHGKVSEAGRLPHLGVVVPTRVGGFGAPTVPGAAGPRFAKHCPRRQSRHAPNFYNNDWSTLKLAPSSSSGEGRASDLPR